MFVVSSNGTDQLQPIRAVGSTPANACIVYVTLLNAQLIAKVQKGTYTNAVNGVVYESVISFDQLTAFEELAPFVYEMFDGQVKLTLKKV
jgi:hypothetical protein